MTTVIENARIIDATGAEPIRDGVLIVEGQRIAAIGARNVVEVPTGDCVETIDARGGTLLPGLIDMHVHIMGELTVQERLAGYVPQTVAAHTIRVTKALQDVVRSGVTTVREAGFPHHGVFALREAIESGDLCGPRLFLSGRALTATGGHCDWMSIQVDGPDAVRKAVRSETKAGADWIKLMATGGTGTPGERTQDVQLTVAEMAAAVDEAHRRGKKVCAHCSCLAGAQALVEAGVDSIEHGIELDDDTVQDMVRQGVWLVPTLKCTAIEGESGPETGIPDFIREKARSIYRTQMRSFQRALAAGVQIAAGTDAGQPYLLLGRHSLVLELALMVHLGMTPMAAIESCTRRAAHLLGASEALGTLEEGKLADVILVDGDPLLDIAALDRVQWVMKQGRLLQESLGGRGSDAALVHTRKHRGQHEVEDER